MIIVTDNGTIPQPPEDEQPLDHLGVTWAGSDGSVWDLIGGPTYILSGARGFGIPQTQHWFKETMLDGAAWQGLRVPAREVFLPLLVRPDDGFVAGDSTFAATLDPRSEGQLRVTLPDARWREISCRYVEGAEGEYDGDPVVNGAAVYGVVLTAPDPYWQGEPVVADYPYTVDSAAFFPGPPFTIVPTRTTTNATVTNPGDVDASAVWRVTGPFTGFTVGVGDSVVAVEHAAAAGEWVEIDLDPRRLTVVDDAGADLWDAVTAFSRSTIPPGEVDLTTMLRSPQIGASVRLSFTPRYWRAW